MASRSYSGMIMLHRIQSGAFSFTEQHKKIISVEFIMEGYIHSMTFISHSRPVAPVA